MEIIDYLTTTDMSGLGGIDERQSFTVNTGGPVDVEMGVFAVGQGLLRPAFQTNYKIDIKDTIIIQAIGISLPYSFVLSSRIVYLKLFWNDGTGTGPINIGDSNVINIPFANFETACQLVLSWPTPRSDPYWIQMSIGSNPEVVQNRIRVSMVGVPVALNAAVLPVTAFMKVSHNLPFVV